MAGNSGGGRREKCPAKRYLCRRRAAVEGELLHTGYSQHNTKDTKRKQHVEDYQAHQH